MRMKLAFPFILIIVSSIFFSSVHSQCSFQEYVDPNDSTCKPCAITCDYCQGPSAIQCSACGTTRVHNSSRNTCDCKPGYVEYSPTVQYDCRELVCDPKCLTCDQIQTNCTSCDSSSFRRQVGNQCACVSKSFDSGVASCSSCHYSCKQCSGAASTQCTDCDLSKFREPVNGQCKCIAKYYDNGMDDQICVSCDTKCATCQTSSTNCLSCDRTRNHDDSAHTCACKDGYVQNSPVTEACRQLVCDTKCLTCNNTETSCTSCDSSLFRTLDSGASQCVCNQKYFDSGATVCSSCHYSCKQCSGAGSTACTSCDSAKYRTSNSNGGCKCMDKYYDDGSSELCLACDVKCSTCQTSSISCVTCHSSRNYDSGTKTCTCKDGHVENSPVTEACRQLVCNPKCLTCNTTETTCKSCDGNLFRTINSGSNQCICNSKYYDSGAALCTLCHYSCKECTTGGSTGCSSCDSTKFRTSDSAGGCKCMDKYYDSGSAELCISCDAKCSTCQTTSTTCLTCHSSRNFDSSAHTCTCKDGYVENNPVTEACRQLICDSKCLTCNNTETSCTSCDSSLFRTLDSGASQCVCNQKYFDSGATVCSSCHYSCKQCSGAGSTACTSCDSAKYRTSNSNGGCKCMDKYYDDGSSELCLACDVKCSTCQTSSISCVTCHSSRNYDSGTKTCTCKDGFVENSPVTEACRQLVCNPKCLTCNTTENTCKSCDSGLFRSFNLATNECLCIAKYYDSGAPAHSCFQCHYSCKECNLAGSTGCTVCDATKFRISDNSGGCICMDKYFNSGTNEVCSACHRKCLTCVTSNSNCLTCGANRLTAPSCACQNQFYDDGFSTSCQPCHYSCKTCTSSNSCTSCDQTTAFRGLSTTSSYCVCLSRYYDTNTLICSPCHNTCFECTNGLATSCTSCSSLANRQLSGSTCACKTGFFQTDPNVQLCSACHYTCKTCQNSATTCLTCSSALFRVFDPAANSCPCMDAYFQSPQTGLCTQCHASCKTCANAAQCLTCDTTGKMYSMNSSNLCSCVDTMYYNTALLKCVSCSTTCKTCSQTSGTYCTSCNTGRTLVSNTCPCLPYYFSNGPICSPCHYSCKTCNGLLETNCLTCSSSNYRNTVLSGGKCLCSTGYYDDGSNMLCKKCSYQCGTCFDATSCLTCDATKFRQTPATMCPCMTGYYEDSSTLACLKCSYYCLTCTEPSICTACNSPNRSLNPVTLTCDCPAKFYDDGTDTELCKSCLPECKTCTAANTCATCEAADFRSLSASSKCPCIDKYYESGGVCVACAYYCKTCSSATTCGSCNSTANRVKDTTTGKCQCKSGYYDTGVEECDLCAYTCLNCTSTQTFCTACDSSRTLLNNACPCSIKYYDDEKAVCPSCQYTCGSCTNSIHCATCDVSKFRTFDSLNVRCACLDKFYDDGSNELCKACNYKCKTCSSSSACLTCDATKFRITPASMCPCMVKYYDSGLNSETCLPCHYSCATCTNSSECATCESTTNHRTYSPSTKKCKCINGFYDDGSNELCLPCDYSCATCATSSTNCLTCLDSTTFRQLINNKCPCQARFYDGNLDSVCQRCQYTCETCSDGVSCDTCNSSKHRQYNVTDDLCHCVDGYFDDLNNHELCQQCHLTCVTCSDSLGCLTCDASKKRLLNSSLMYDGSTSNYCICQYGHYSPGDTLACQSCHYSCEVCNGPSSSQCLHCDTDADRSLTNSKKCSCIDGYFEDGVNELCPPCHVNCLTCSGPSNSECFSCSIITFYMSNQTTCYLTCPDYHFDDTNYMICSRCGSHCIDCVDQNICTECETGHYLLRSDKKCYKICPDGMWQNPVTKTCDNCPEGCKTCDSDVKCLDCINHYYFDTTVELCFSCYQNCKSCIGPGQDQCLSCYEPLYFKSNKCHNLTCPYGQYVDSVLGCKYCSDLFSNSLTCNKSEAFLCLDAYKLKDGQCKICSDVEGYHITPSTRTCSQICGDGKLFDYQCDDGNQLDGDGCSKNCIIENGWSCSASSIGSISVCRLESALSMSLQRMQKYSGKNKVTLYFVLSLPYRLVNGFLLKLNNIVAQDLSWKHVQSPDNLTSVSLTIDYSKSLQGQKLVISYESSNQVNSRRLFNDFLINLESKNENKLQMKSLNGQDRAIRLLTLSSIAFDENVELLTFPPVDFYNTSEIEFFQKARQIIFYLALVLMVLSLVIIPKKTHLHSFTFSFIVAKVWLIFGLALEDKLDWVNHVLKDIKPWAMVGGFSMGPCCHNVSTFYEYKSELVSNSLFVLIAWVAVWMTLGVVYFINKFISKIEVVVQYVNYFAVTIHLVLGFHIFYSSLNSLYHYSIQNLTDVFNTTLSIGLTLLSSILIILIWVLTNRIQFNIQNENELLKTKTITSQNVFEKNSSHQDFSKTQRHTSQIHSIIELANGQHHENCFDNLETHHKCIDPPKQIQISEIQSKNSTESVEQNNFGRLTIWDYSSEYDLEKKNSKYFLPISLTVNYVQIILIVFLAPFDKFYFIIIEGSIELIYFIYIIAKRPFMSKFTNFRLCMISFCFISMFGMMAYYIYLSQNSIYFKIGQITIICLSGFIFVLGIIFSLLEHIISWVEQIRYLLKQVSSMFERKQQPKVHDLKDIQIYMGQRESQDQIQVEEIKSDLSKQQMDTFYARILKKQAINKKYRRERKMKQNIYRPY